MSTTLPGGLLNISSRESHIPRETDVHEARFLKCWSLAQFWKISSTRNKFTRSIESTRGENIFWRLWNDPSHRETISEAGISQLCNLIQQPVEPSSFELNMTWKRNSPETLSMTHSERQDNFNLKRSDSSEMLLFRSVQVQGDERPLAPCAADQDPEGILDKSSSTQEVVTGRSRPKASRSTSSRGSTLGTNLNLRDRPTSTVASGTKPKKLILGRRKNSATAVQYLRGPKSPGLGTRQDLPQDTTSTTQEIKEHADRSSKTVFQLPSASSSWEDDSDDKGDYIAGSMRNTGPTTPLDIDPDFRNKFSQKIASSSSLTLPSHMRKTGSVVRFAIDDAGESAGPVGNDAELRPRHVKTNRPPLFQRHSTNSVAIVDGDEGEEEEAPTLTRNQSHLSFLISERRATQGEESLGVQSASLQQHKTKGKKKQAEDEKILAMAQRQGVTKAGGIQVPRQHRLQGEVDSRYSSPDRDLTF